MPLISLTYLDFLANYMNSLQMQADAKEMFSRLNDLQTWYRSSIVYLYKRQRRSDELADSLKLTGLAI